MSAPLRQIVADFIVTVDDSPLTKLDRQIKKIKEGMQTFMVGWAAAAAVATAATWKFVEAASDAAEQINVLDQAFGEGGADRVAQWSKEMGAAMGRSQFQLQKMTAEFGASLDPMLESLGGGVDTEQMSKDLAVMSVDLASFFNLASDEEAKLRLKSGLAGETEAVRRLGIDISDAALRELHEKRVAAGTGRDVQYRQLSNAEKVMLRWVKIQQDSANAQGDAIRTANGWANQLKRLQGFMQDLSVKIGMVAKKALLPLLQNLNKMSTTIENLILNSAFLETAFKALTVAGIAAAASWLILNPVAALIAVVLTEAFFLWEDFNSLMNGYNSVLGELMQALGIADPRGMMQTIMDGFRIAFDTVIQAFKDFAQLVWNIASIATLQKKPGQIMEGVGGLEAVKAKQRAREAERDAENRAAMTEAANEGDLGAFQLAALKMGKFSKDQILAGFGESRAQQILTGAALPTMKDVESGLVTKDQASAAITTAIIRKAQAGEEVTAAQKASVEAVTGKSFAESTKIEIKVGTIYAQDPEAIQKQLSVAAKALVEQNRNQRSKSNAPVGELPGGEEE